MENNLQFKKDFFERLEVKIKEKKKGKYDDIFMENLKQIEYGIKNGLSIATIAKEMGEAYHMKISDKALRSFCENKGIARTKKRKTKMESTK